MFLPLNNYQARQIKGYSIITVIALVLILFFGNIITAIVKDSVTVDENSYILKNGFPIFTSQKEYIALIKNYPHNPGVKLKIHKTNKNESYWSITKKYNITIDTLIGANPFLKDFSTKNEIEIVIPEENGLLLSLDDFRDVSRMKELLRYKGEARGDYFPTIFKIFSTDDIRLVFFKNAIPEIVNSSIERMYSFRKIFQAPFKGYFSSMYGVRVDPFLHGMMKFHNGLDIIGRYGAPIKPAREGIVIFSGWRTGYGKTVIIQHHDGYTTLYGHCSSLNVKKGDWVTKKNVIGNIGSTGRSTGPHLHFTIMRHGKIIDPLLFIW